MKTILLTFTFLLLGNLSFAQLKLIAIKGATTDTIATTLADAITLAQPNDKIYLPGGYFSFDSTLQKPLHIIGTGFQDGMNVFGRTIMSGNFNMSNLANGSIFEGLYMSDWFYSGASMSNVTFKRCDMKGVLNANGVAWSNCKVINCSVREVLYFGEAVYGQNNVIENSIILNLNHAQYSTVSNSIIAFVHHCDNVLLKNNIFTIPVNCTDIFYGTSSNIIMNNNMVLSACVGSGYGGSILSESNTIGFNSIADVFVSAASFVFNPTYNFQLLAASPGNNAGTDGTDIGIFGGNYPWKVGSLPINPNIEQNNSYLDVLNEEFKLNVKVVPQTN
jgi:hypothetical protein